MDVTTIISICKAGAITIVEANKLINERFEEKKPVGIYELAELMAVNHHCFFTHSSIDLSITSNGMQPSFKNSS
jgi:hypothetical protein